MRWRQSWGRRWCRRFHSIRKPFLRKPSNTQHFFGCLECLRFDWTHLNPLSCPQPPPAPLPACAQLARALIGLVVIAHFPLNHHPARAGTLDVLVLLGLMTSG